MEKCLENESAKEDVTYAKDFYYLVKEIIPLRVRITKGLSDIFCMNSTILEKVQKNLAMSGSAEMVAFWSKYQFNLAMNCLSQTRVLFESGFSTGKTISMIHCMSELLKINKKVLFVIHEDIYKHQIAKNCPSLLNIKIKNHFEQLCHDGHFQDMHQFKVVEVNLKNQKAFDDLCQKYPDFHFFVDEVKFINSTGILSADGIRNKIYFSCGVTNDLLTHWSQKIPPEFHLWVAICYNKNELDSNSMESYFPTRPEMINPMRNVANTIELVKSKCEIKSSYDLYSSNALNDTSKLDEINLLNIPTNLTRSFPPIIFQAKQYKDGFAKVIKFLKEENHTSSALIVIPWLSNVLGHCECYKNKIGTSEDLKAHIHDIYHKFKRTQPIVYFKKSHEEDAKNWVCNIIPSTNKADLITDFNLVNGFEHPIVVMFNRDGFFEHNIAMRSTGLLIIVNIPTYESWRAICFSENPSWYHYSSNIIANKLLS